MTTTSKSASKSAKEVQQKTCRTLSYDPLWKKLIDLRLTKTELAEKAGISRGIITRMGKGEIVTLDAIVKICVALDCDIYDVIEMKKNTD